MKGFSPQQQKKKGKKVFFSETGCWISEMRFMGKFFLTHHQSSFFSLLFFLSLCKIATIKFVLYNIEEVEVYENLFDQRE